MIRCLYKYMFLAVLSVALFACSRRQASDGQAGDEAILRQLQQRDSVLIGDQLWYGVRLNDVREGTQISAPDYTKEFIDSVEVVSSWVVDTTATYGKKDAKRDDLEMGVVLTSFDEGEYVLPDIVLARQNPDGTTDTLRFKGKTLEVKTIPVDTATYEICDIKGQVRYPLTWAEVWPYLAAAWAVIVLTILIVCLIIIHKRKGESSIFSKDPPHIVALRKLDKYRGNKHWEPEKQKAFYSGVTDVLREYIAARFGFGAMEMTTAEIFDNLKTCEDVTPELFDETHRLFVTSDLVKFAKMSAEDEENACAVPVAVRFVTSTYQVEVEKEENKDGGKQ